MLPFLKPKVAVSVIIARQKDGKLTDEHEEGQEHAKHMEAAEKLIAAVHEKDAEAVAKILMSLTGSEEAEESKDAEKE
jgi:hypothetical protein